MRYLLTILFAFSVANFGLAQEKNAGIKVENFDKSIRVQDNLYEHVNGTWLKKTKIPDDKTNYGAFSALADQSQQRIRQIIELAAKSGAAPGTNEQKIGDFYKSIMDEEAIEKRGIAPIKSHLDRIDSLDSHEKVFEAFGFFNRYGVDVPVGVFVMQDMKDSERYMAQVAQGGTSLPDRDYYLKDDERTKAVQSAFTKYIATIWDAAEFKDSESVAKLILDLETQIAEKHLSRVEMRNVLARYNKFDLDKLGSTYSNLPFIPLLKEAGLGDIKELNVMTPKFIDSFDEMFEKVSVADWKQYLRYKVLDAASAFLPKKFEDASFELYQKTLGGVKEKKARWKTAVDTISGRRGKGVLGEAVAETYVKKYFPEEAKVKMDKLVDNLIKAFDTSIDELEWMSDETKKQAKKKLSMFTSKVGYPKKWMDYSALKVQPDDLFGNLLRSREVEYNRMIKKLNQSVDREEWGMTPQTVNAYYNPMKNEIVFPAAILQPPFFDMEGPDALNYGGIGAVIGHEISHGFDDQGSQFDGSGNMKNWWTAEDRAAFKALADRLVAQYGEYEPLPGKKVNGKLTLGENIADLSGLSIAYKAFKISRKGKEPKEYLGWNEDQLFFVGWSRVWARKYREAEMIRRLLTDSHSPSAYRANGPVMNIDAFYEAFNVKEGDRLFKPRAERIRIW